MRYLVKVKVATRNDNSIRWVVLGTSESLQQITTLLHIHEEMIGQKSELQITAYPDPDPPVEELGVPAAGQKYDVWKCSCGNVFNLPADANLQAAEIVCKSCNWAGIAKRVRPG